MGGATGQGGCGGWDGQFHGGWETVADFLNVKIFAPTRYLDEVFSEKVQDLSQIAHPYRAMAF